MKLATININWDSLNEAYGFPEGFTDKCYFEVAERFMAIADKYNFKYSIFIVGRDLENGRHREAVKEWARRGHEIGNHSWSHHMDLGALPMGEIRTEVGRAHDAIARCIGSAPQGFISPAWSSSRALWDVLIEHGYTYDTSTYPSWLLFPMVSRIAFGYRGSPKAGRILRRRDWLRSLFGSRHPYLYKARRSHISGRELLVLPLPTTPMRMACWHTTGFIFGWTRHERWLDACLSSIDCFYYLTHPGDLLAADEVDSRYTHSLARVPIDIADKIDKFERMVQRIIASGRQLITLAEMAEYQKTQLRLSCEPCPSKRFDKTAL